MNAPDPSRVVVFNHIPKSAGTSVRECLRAGLQPESSIYYLDQSLVGGYDNFDEIDPQARARFVFDPSELPDAEFVSGHISPYTTMQRYPGARHVSVLRNPACRVISQWVHGRSLTDLDLRHWGPAYGFRVARFGLARYLEHAMIAPNIDNCITRFFTWPHPAIKPDAFIGVEHDEELFERAVATIDAMLHVNVIENKAFMDELGEALGVTLTEERLNDRSSFPPVVPTDLGSELDASTRALLDHRTRLDRRIWEHVASRAMPGADLHGILEAGLEDSVRRYSALPAAPARGGAVRRTAEWVYRTKARFDPRLRDFR